MRAQRTDASDDAPPSEQMLSLSGPVRVALLELANVGATDHVRRTAVVCSALLGCYCIVL